MAELDLENARPEQLISQGTRAYIIRDYNNAVQMLSKAIEKVTAAKDERDDYLGEAYLYYGKSLLEYSREEDDPFGDAVPREIKTGESEETDDDDDDDGDTDAAETAEQTGKEQDKPEEAKAEDKKPLGVEETKAENEAKSKEENESKSKDEKETKLKTENEAKSKEKIETKSKEENESETKEENEDESKEENEAELKKKNLTELATEKTDKINGKDADFEDKTVASTSTEKDEEKGEDITGEEVEDDNPSDLQLAWEVLELAKIIFKSRGEKGENLLADTLVSLGEVSMESENFVGAINDIKEGIEIQERICEKHSRRLSESYYKLGIAFAANNQLEEAVGFFEKSHAILVDRLSILEKDPVNNRDELKELNGLIPEIQEKVTDTKNFKNELIKQKSTTENENENASTVTGSEKTVNDISHLVRRKRMLGPIVEEGESPAKKPSP